MKRHYWSVEEVEFLETKWGVYSIKAIAKSLNRSIDSVRNKAIRMKLGRHLHCIKEVTLYQLIKNIGLEKSYQYVAKKFIENGLKIKYKASLNKKYRVVDIDIFWKWAKENRKILNFSKFEKGSLGPEPDWVDEKRKIDKMNPTKVNHNRVWTKEEQNLLIEKVKSNKYTYEDLSKEFNRTENAIKRKLSDLKVKCRPIPRENHIKWTDNENKMLIELHNKGYDSYVIAKYLNKTQLSICDRIKVFC